MAPFVRRLFTATADTFAYKLSDQESQSYSHTVARELSIGGDHPNIRDQLQISLTLRHRK